jgi:DNA-directed RNA polymerase subunit RPC12/RpoP
MTEKKIKERCSCCGKVYTVSVPMMADVWISCPDCGFERSVAIRHYKIVHYYQ